ncbi:MAG: type II secretion system protein GspG [Phycisphaerales bacterium]|nr:type II secretion system protein GspG [Phycisphaerales bacterium]
MDQILLPKRRMRAAHGFSLLELTLVVVIMGVLMSVVAISVLGQGDKAKIQATKTSMTTIQQTLDSYHLEYNAYPPTLQLLQQLDGYLQANKPVEDGWKHAYWYKAPGTSRPYELVSMGKDGEYGTADDMDIWTVFQNQNSPQQ